MVFCAAKDAGYSFLTSHLMISENWRLKCPETSHTERPEGGGTRGRVELMEADTDRQRQTQRDTERQRQRHTKAETETQKEKHTEKETERERKRNRQTDSPSWTDHRIEQKHEYSSTKVSAQDGPYALHHISGKFLPGGQTIASNRKTSTIQFSF